MKTQVFKVSLVPFCAVAVFSLAYFGAPDAGGSFGVTAAHAKNEKGNNGNGRGNGGNPGREGATASAEHEAGHRGRGHVARELRNMNAANAFKNGNVPNMNPNSNVGQIAAYQAAARELAEAEGAVGDAADTLASFGLDPASPTYDQDLADALAGFDTRIDELDENADEFEAQKGALESEQMALSDAAKTYDDAVAAVAPDGALATAEADSFGVVSRGRSIGEEALGAFRDMLGLD